MEDDRVSKELTNQDMFVLARSKLWTEALDKLLRRWKRQVNIRCKGHYEVAAKYNRRHYILGLPVTVISTITATGTLATFRNCSNCDDLSSQRCALDPWIRLIIGIVGLLSVALVSIMTFINYQEAANDHKAAADNYESLYGTIESQLIVPVAVRGDPLETLRSIRAQYNDTVKKSPNLPSKYQVDLSFKKLPCSNNSQDVVIPVLNPEDVGGFNRDATQASEGANILRNLLYSPTKSEEFNDADGLKGVSIDTERLEGILRDENNFDSEDDEREVYIGFDLDNYPGRVVEDKVQNSFLLALEFEMQRQDGTTGTPLQRRSLEQKEPLLTPTDDCDVKISPHVFKSLNLNLNTCDESST